MNTEAYDWVIVDAEGLIGDERIMKEIRAVQFYAILDSLKDAYPDSRRHVVAFDADEGEETSQWRTALFSEAASQGWVPLKSSCRAFDTLAWFAFSFLDCASDTCLVVGKDERLFGLLSGKVDLLHRGADGLKMWTTNQYQSSRRHTPEMHWLYLAAGGDSGMQDSLSNVERVIYKDEIAEWLIKVPVDSLSAPEFLDRLRSILPKRLTTQSESLFRYWLHRRGSSGE
ncbi:hypothetical protein [Pelagicoccus sp. SDUM812002]|uniref:hypothetical protein n=1 Tax=Pelagicoccus sp. SDUM812002 TaxID=3041266 RepID=UPI00280E017E|nr:hypothetical protein [Pelagicoccus sp. SDUM812002]MDQ8184077.1 hypothetical protein [Pelagicoccus sp. SDUM812002]